APRATGPRIAGTTRRPHRASGDDPTHGVVDMHWTLLVFAGLLEIAWAIGLKYSEGLSRPLPATLTVLALIGSFGLLALALRGLPLATGYAAWVGIGVVGTALAGSLLFDEPLGLLRGLCIGLILLGVLGLKLLPA